MYNFYSEIKQHVNNIEEEYPMDYLKAIALTLTLIDLKFKSKPKKTRTGFINRVKEDSNRPDFNDEKITYICEKLRDENKDYDFLRYYILYCQNEVYSKFKGTIIEV